MIDLATGWFEILRYNEKQDNRIANLLEQTWFYRYTNPRIITYDQGNEFLGHEFKNDLIERKYINKSKCATTENSQAK